MGEVIPMKSMKIPSSRFEEVDKMPLMAKWFGKSHVEHLPEVCSWIRITTYKGKEYRESEGFLCVDTTGS